MYVQYTNSCRSYVVFRRVNDSMFFFVCETACLLAYFRRLNVVVAS
jgi:hypothetical protein